MIDREEAGRQEPDKEVEVGLLIELLAEPLGLDKAETVVHDSLQQLGFFGRKTLAKNDCRKVLEMIAEEGGLVAIAARLAKIKLISDRTWV